MQIQYKLKWLIFYSKQILIFFRDFIYGIININKFKNIKCFCLFIGYPRSGHSIVGACLNAHPEVIISNEADIFKYFKYLFSRYQIFYRILHFSKNLKTKRLDKWNKYSFHFEIINQYDFKNLKIIGDKKGGKTTFWLKNNPEFLNKLENKIKLKIKFIHVIRNPFDNISTMVINKKLKQNINLDELIKQINRYFEKVDAINILKKNIEIIDIFHEDFIINPDYELKRLTEFLDIKNNLNWIKECKKVIYKNPNKSRFEIDWSKELIEYVNNKIKNTDYLKRYSFNS